MRILSLLLALAIFLFPACQNAEQATEDDADEMTDTDDSSEKMYVLTPFGASTEYADASITSMKYQNGQFVFTLGESDYKLGVQTPDAEQKMCANSDQGQHIHLIVDNEPYAAYYVPSFQHDVSNGEHYLLAFLSRSYHESLKHDAASVAQKVMVNNKSITAQEDITQPMLFYSRPKGTYTGKSQTDKVMLDFYLVNAALGTDYMVKADINGETHMIETWQPYYIEGLPMGDNTITLTLVDREGNAVDAPLNPVSRTFTLVADPMDSQ